MPKAKQDREENLKERLGRQIEGFLKSLHPEPQKEAMKLLAAEAERLELVHVKKDIRREDVMAFMLDLWYENPAIEDRLNLHRETLPKSVEGLSDALDALR